MFGFEALKVFTNLLVGHQLIKDHSEDSSWPTTIEITSADTINREERLTV